ncbi:hypothetical protein [Streptomyces sp. NPDC056723]|uniref:hypothetical protein n=1 Tax=Streptomyces sp. NPDC056723 TaxID=3345925 RepID=UPI00367DB5CC
MSAATEPLSAADRAARAAASYVRVTPDVERAVVRYEIAKAAFDRLSAMDARDMSGRQVTLMTEAQGEMAERRAFLESVGQLHRIEMQ